MKTLSIVLLVISITFLLLKKDHNTYKRYKQIRKSENGKVNTYLGSKLHEL